MKLRRLSMINLAESFENGTLKNDIITLPKKMLPGPNSTYRDSVYLEREILKQRIKIYLGLDYYKTKDMELFEISENLDEIIDGKSELLDNEKSVTVIEEACDSCPSGKYYVTDLCRNCVAHSCYNVCPKKAISIKDSRAFIDNEKCIGCGLCSKACNYFAIVKLERPCERACSVGAIEKTKDNINTVKIDAAHIDREKCVDCGACYVSCPFGAVETPSQLFRVLNDIKKNEKVVAIFAPAIVSQFGPKVDIGKIKSALEKSGFYQSYEVALGADMVAEEEAEMLEKNPDFMTTSCCPAFVNYIKKHKKEFITNISEAYSPMTALAKYLKSKDKDIKVVFIGPCIAKKTEARENKYVDYVITFEELGALFVAKKIEPTESESLSFKGTKEAWGFAVSGGVTEAVKKHINKELKIIYLDGLENANDIFKKVSVEKYDLLEGMACSGGCIAGPGVIVNPVTAKNGIKRINIE